MKKTLCSKKGIILASIAMLLTAVCLAAWYFLSPSAYIALDVNPSIELRTNRLGQVVSLTAVNEDGRKLLEGYRLRDRDLDDVIEDLVDRMLLTGYLDNAKDNDILITVSDKDISKQTLERINNKVASYLKARQVQAQIIGQDLDLDDDLLELARKNNVSAGKMAVIEQITKKLKELTPEKLASMRISDLLDYAQKNNIPLSILEDHLDNLEDKYPDARLDDLEHALDKAEDAQDEKDGDDDMDDLLDDVNDFDDDDDFDDDYARSRYTSGTASRPSYSSKLPSWDDDDDDDDDFDDDDFYRNRPISATEGRASSSARLPSRDDDGRYDDDDDDDRGGHDNDDDDDDDDDD